MDELLSNDILVFLLLAHLVGDFALQSDATVEAKRQGRVTAHLHHAGLHALLAYLCLGLWTLWLLPIVIGIAHGAIDYIKETTARQMNRSAPAEMPRAGRAAIFLTDQLLHIAVIIIAAALLIDPAVVPGWIGWYGDIALAAAVALIGLIITTWGGAVVIGYATEPYLDHLRGEIRRQTHAGQPPAGSPEEQADAADAIRRGFPRGGRTIGLLERALVFLFVITGNMTGVGFLVAAKSVFRFGEISRPTQRKEAEYILIGTLMSFTWAIFAAWLTRGAISALAGM